MNCKVCFATWAEGGNICPQCGFDQAKATDAQAVLAARQVFRDKTTAYAPQTRVSTLDKLKPWLAVGLAFFIFIFWMRACSTGGFRF